MSKNFYFGPAPGAGINPQNAIIQPAKQGCTMALRKGYSLRHRIEYPPEGFTYSPISHEEPKFSEHAVKE